MKTLYIIRHAKSSWDDINLDDFDRSLNKRGKKDADLIWEKLKEKKVFPDVVYSSSAKRAKKTIKKISKKIDFPYEKIHFDNSLYDNHAWWIDFYLSYIMEINDKHKSAFLVWHNYVWTDLANYFLNNQITNIPTSWIVCIKFDIKSWKDIASDNSKLKFFIYPKKYHKKI